MYATLCGTGLIVTFEKQDKRILKYNGRLETMAGMSLSKSGSKVVVHVCDYVKDKYGEPQIASNRLGIRLHTRPTIAERNKTPYFSIWIDRNIADRLLETGYVGGRFHIDRLEMIFREAKHPDLS
jgi:hypothetical protein